MAAFFPDSFIEQLRDRVVVSDVVRSYIAIKRKGREFEACCPFHKEKTPSFTINDEKGFYHCFGCGAHGDGVKFVQTYEGLSFTDAITKLADQLGLALPKPDPKVQMEYDKVAVLYRVMDRVAKWFINQLQSGKGESVREYLEGRGIDQEVSGYFALGFAPNQEDGLYQYLKSQNIAESMMVELGLVRKSTTGTGYYDYFRNRLMFPIWDKKDRVIAFGGRALADQKAKYLNSPETPIFHKSEILYHLSGAKNPSYTHKQLFVVEGYMDVIALYRAGIKHAVAPLGTAFTDGHLKQVWRLSPNPIFCFDGDSAGKRALMRVCHLMVPHLQPGYTLEAVLLPKGMDPDDLLNLKGTEGLIAALSDSIALSELLWQEVIAQQSSTTPEGMAALKRYYENTFLTPMQHAEVKRQYQHYFKQRFYGYMRSVGKGYQQLEETSTLHIAPSYGEDERIIAALVLLVITHPRLLCEEEGEHLLALETQHATLSSILGALGLIVLETEDNFVMSSSVLRCYLRDKGMSALVEELEKQPYVGLGSLMDTAADYASVKEGFTQLSMRYMLVNLQQEYQEALSVLTDASEKRAKALKIQIDSLQDKLAAC